MKSKHSVLDLIQIASPCPMSWHEMEGDDRVRFCEECSLNVYNLSGMKRAEAEALVTSTEGRLCVRYHQRADGTIITRDCPIGLAAARRAVVRLGGIVAAVCVALVSAAWAIGTGSRSCDGGLALAEPFRSVARRLAPPIPMSFVLGELVYRPVPTILIKPDLDSSARRDSQ